MKKMLLATALTMSLVFPAFAQNAPSAPPQNSDKMFNDAPTDSASDANLTADQKKIVEKLTKTDLAEVSVCELAFASKTRFYAITGLQILIDNPNPTDTNHALAIQYLQKAHEWMKNFNQLVPQYISYVKKINDEKKLGIDNQFIGEEIFSFFVKIDPRIVANVFSIMGTNFPENAKDTYQNQSGAEKCVNEILPKIFGAPFVSIENDGDVEFNKLLETLPEISRQPSAVRNDGDGNEEQTPDLK